MPWVREHQIDSSLFASAHPEATVPGVLESLALRERIIDFAIEARGSSRPSCSAASATSSPMRPAAARVAGAAIDLADIQGDVLRGYTYPCAAYLFLRIVDPERMRALHAPDARRR